MAKGKLSTTITLTITIILAITVYSLEFNVFDTESSLMNSTKKYIHQAEAGKMYEPKYVLSEKIGSQMIVVFSDKNYENFMGAIVFQRGVTGLWRPTKAQFETGPVIQSISTNENLNEDIYTAYFSINCPPEIKSYKTSNIYIDKSHQYVTDVLDEKKITGPKFIDVHKADIFAVSLSLYDKDGVELPREKYLAMNQGYPNVAMSTAELGFINIVCLIIIAIGGSIAWLSYRKQRQ